MRTARRMFPRRRRRGKKHHRETRGVIENCPPKLEAKRAARHGRPTHRERPMNTKPKQNRTTETLGELINDEGLKETLPKEAGEMMLDKLYDKMAREGGPIPRT